MPALMVAHRRPGFYLRVIDRRAGSARVDDIIKISTGPAADLRRRDRRAALPAGASKDDLERALRIPALSPGWKGSLQSLLQQADGRARGGGNTGLTAAAASRRRRGLASAPSGLSISRPKAAMSSHCPWPAPMARRCPAGCPANRSRCGCEAAMIIHRSFAATRCRTDQVRRPSGSV